VTSPFSFSGDCTVNAATGASASQGGQDAGALFILSSASEGGITFNAQFNDGTLSARDYTQDDTRHWSLLVTDDSGGPGATVSYLRAQSDTFGAFTLHLTSASADSFGTIDAHGTLSASYNQPLDDGGSTAIAVDSSF